ncbi:type III secretion system apparatus protein [Candidatus Regiella insecticola LSR1]|uniref:Type III secretion system apparatus protein n=1 Tax=Candidatus Regiella insecticola LSR1 TaxID=663321 RepID=E0WTJ5_9ENTR|nr:hypothetical protein [Candidatus Regiella insecticola]EFL91880.1 type III secretion system apparatus protein [Candidatus Regiella insecticola LSR1]
MDMDLVVVRNLQLFFRLAELPYTEVKPSMEWRIGQRAVFIEVHQQRILLTTGRLNPQANLEELRTLQQRWRLERFYGIPQRIYLLSIGIMVSCCPHTASGAEFWYQIYKQQYALLKTLEGEWS